MAGAKLPASRPRRLLRNLDLWVAGLALPIFVAAGLPVLGWAAAAAIWFIQRLIQVVLQRRADVSENPTATVGLLAGGAIMRGMFTALSVLAVGILADDRTGLSAVVLLLVLFTVYFGQRLFEHALAQTAPGAPPGAPH